MDRFLKGAPSHAGATELTSGSHGSGLAAAYPELGWLHEEAEADRQTHLTSQASSIRD